MSIEATKSSRFLLHLNPSSPQRTAITTKTTMSTGRRTQPDAAAMVATTDTSHWFVVLDRFVSASTGDDVTSSLQSILDTLTTTTNGDIVNDFIDIMTTSTSTNTNTNTTVAEEEEEEDMAGMVLTTLLHIFGTSEFPKHRIYIEDGISMVARIYTTILQRSKRPKDMGKVLLLQPPKQAGRFVEACIDVASATTVQPQPYPRVLALQLIQSVASHQPSIVQHQLLSTPNGIHRLGDLLLYQPTTTTNDSTTATGTANVPEEVQLAMITLSVTTLSKWSSVAKIWIFNEIIDHVIRIAIQQEGGIYSAAVAENSTTTTGNFNVVMDCLLIIQQLLSHDTTFGELVIQSSTIFINNLYYNIFDLRNGTNFRHPPKTLPSTTSTAASTTSTKNNEDDLDDLIASASKSQTDSSTATATNGTLSADGTPQQLRLPMLTDLEEQMINLVLDILCTLLENPKIATFVVQNHANFCTLIWEMGLLTIPMGGGGSDNDGPPAFTCAIPSVSLQQRALHVIGTYLNSITILEQNIHSGYDRLLYLVCTGMGGVAAVARDSDDAVDRGNNMYRISQAALYVVRRTIPKQTINDLLMYTLAPPPATTNSIIDKDDDGNDKPGSTDPQNQVTIVSKLLRTVLDNVFVTPAASTDNQQPRLVCLSGALGALSLFMTDDVNRSILLRITVTAATANQDDSTKTTLIQTLFTCLVQEITSHENRNDCFVAIQLLRFLCTWITDAPEIVQVILNESTQSMMQLSQFVASTNNNSVSGRGEVVVAVLIHLLFGLSLHSLNNVNEDMSSGGWTRSNIVTLLQRNSMISQQIDLVKSMKEICPWSSSTYEWSIWTSWYNDTVRTVRQRIIQELVSATTAYEERNNNTNQADGGAATDNDNNEASLSLPMDNVTSATNVEYRKEIQTMRNLVTDLTQETERLRLELSESERLISTQDKQLTTWKQRVESTPTELDDMLNAITSKNDVLENTIDNLRAEVKAMESKHASELAERDATIETLRNELSKSRAQETDIGLERDSLRDDMMALSQAYTNLETEYRQQVSISTTTVPSSNEHNTPIQDSDAHTPVGSTEVSTLRAENERMRQEAQAADEWMSMAVERMQAMTNEIVGLKDQITASPATNVQEKSQGSQPNEIVSLQKRLEDLESQIVSDRLELEIITQRESAEISVRDARIQELEAAVQNLGRKNEEMEVLQQEIRSLHEANESAQDWMSKAVQHHQVLAEQITSLTEQNMELNALEKGVSEIVVDETLSSRLQADVVARDNEIEKLKETIASFQLRFEESQEQATTIAQLEQDLDEVRAQLERVTSKLESKERELEIIQSQMQAFGMVNRYEEQTTVVESLQVELANRTEEVNMLTNEIDEMRVRNSELQQKVDDLETVRIESGTKEEEILSLRARMAESEARKEAIQKILEAVAKEKEELTSEFDKNQLALEEIESELNKMRRGDLDATHSNEIEENLVELQATIKTLETQLNAQCDEATSVVQQWEQTHSALQSDYNELDSNLKLVLEEKLALETEFKEGHNVVAKLQDELETLKDAQNIKISELESLLENIKDQMIDQERDFNDTINQWQENYNAIEAKLQLATTENRDLTVQLNEAKELAACSTSGDDVERIHLAEHVKALEKKLQEQENEALTVVAQWQDSYNEVQSELQEALLKNENQLSKEIDIRTSESSEHHDDQLAELILQMKNLEEQLSDQEKEASDIVLQWQESYNAIEATLKATVEEKNEALAQLTQIRERKVDPEKDISNVTVDDLQLKVTQLEQELASHEEEANNVVNQWQQCYNDAIAETEAVSLELQAAKDSIELFRSSAGSVEDQTYILDNKPSSTDGVEAAAEAFQWQEKYASVSRERELTMATMKELEDKVTNLHQQLANQVSDSNSTVQQWQQSCDDISSKCLRHESENESLSSELKELKEQYASLESKCHELSESTARVKILEKQLDESLSTIDNLQQQLDAVNDIVNQWQESHSHVTDELKVAMLELQERRDASAAQMKQLNDAFASVDNSYNEVAELKAQIEMDKETILFLEDKVKMHASELLDWQVKYDGINESLNELTEQNALLRSTVDSLEKEHAHQIKDRDTAIYDWEQKYADMTNERADTEELKRSISKQSEKLLALEEESKNLRLDLMTKQDLIASLEKQLVEQEEDARNIVMQWQQSYEALQTHCEEMIVELEASRESLSMLQLQSESSAKLSPIVDAEVKDRSEQEQIELLELKVEELQCKLADEKEQAQNVISQWQIECTNVASDLAFALGENEELAERLRIFEETRTIAEQHDTNSNIATSNELKAKIIDVTKANDQLQVERSMLKQQIDETLQGNADLATEIETLRTKLSEQLELEPRLKSDITALESRLSCHIDENARLLQIVESQQSEISTLQDKLNKLTEDISFQQENLKSDKDRMKATFEAQQIVDKEKLGLLEFEMERLRNENASLTKERDQLSMRLAELDDKLVQANDTLQIVMTDQASKEATELAAEALREEVRSMHHQAQIDRATISNLSQARSDAETEVERLQNDITTLLGFESYEANQTAIQKRTMEAAESLQCSERNEIRALKSSLSRALDELAISRASEQELEERAAKAMHQASMYEQELVSSKSDFQFLTQTMDEMRESESSRRLSLEYRISSLENEQNVLRHYHNTELEHVRNELSHVTMERDGLFQSLKESERSNAILRQATSRDRSMNGDDHGGDPQIELNRLRMEKSQLLTAAADDASRMEHRLREAHAATKASADAEIFMERELRIQAEKALERNLLEMSELRMVGMDKRHGSYNLEQLENQLEYSYSDLQKVRNESQILRAECSALRQQLHEVKKESGITINRLTEECRVAKARCSYIEKETQREAEIRIEVARIQSGKPSSTRNTPERGVVLSERNNPAADDDNMAATKLYDALQKQKQATEEERVVYFELLTEHDNLLALLAQQDLLKTSYQRTLLRLCGSDAVNTAIREAEEQAQKQYGKYIQLK